jgi:hypothetical protein
MALPVTRYAKSGNIHTAYQVFGSGPIDLVIAPGFVSHIENCWDQPDLARWLLRLSTFARVAIFDKRGIGLSDPVSRVRHWISAWTMRFGIVVARRPTVAQRSKRRCPGLRH